MICVITFLFVKIAAISAALSNTGTSRINVPEVAEKVFTNIVETDLIKTKKPLSFLKENSLKKFQLF